MDVAWSVNVVSLAVGSPDILEELVLVGDRTHRIPLNTIFVAVWS